MTALRTNILLWLVAGLFTAGTVLTAAWAVFATDPVPADAGPQLRGATPAGPVAADPPLAAFEAVWDRELGQPLDPPTPPPVAPATRPAMAFAPPPPPAKLVGTILEPGYSMAIFARADGRPELRAVGESAGGAEVLRIESDAVTVRHNGRPLVLRVERATTVPAGTPNAQKGRNG